MGVRADLARRVTLLERRHGRIELPKIIILCGVIEPDSLAPGERIVTDWISDVDGYVVSSNRITSNPTDQGKRCVPVTTWSRGISWIH